jgi:hypothetical protein
MDAPPGGQLAFDFGGDEDTAPRRPLTRADVQEQVRALAARGRPLDEIARALGLTTAQVRRRLRRAQPGDQPRPHAEALTLPLGAAADAPAPDEAPAEPGGSPPSAQDGVVEGAAEAGTREPPAELTYEPLDDWPPIEWRDPD